MAPPIESFIETPTRTRIQVGLAPAFNAIHSLVMLADTENLSGLGDWVVKTARQLSAEERQRHRYVIIGFYHALLPTRIWSSFPAYLDYLAEEDPVVLRNRILDKYLSLPPVGDVQQEFTRETAISSVDSFLELLAQKFDHAKIEEDLERWAYGYILDPPAMQELIVQHLRKFWDQYLASEWERIRPTLMEAVDAFSKVDFSQMDNVEAANYVLGQSVCNEHIERKVDEAESLYFAPSLHVGPYLGKFMFEDSHGFIFGARLPDNTDVTSPMLSQAELYVRLNALADETRLQILEFISNRGEACSTEIINALGLSQSAASRHLTQLTATGYLIARRRDGAKCYQLDKERIESTLDTVRGFLKLS
jgi:DNA-binding transcriptional ArsR family regulator